MTSDHDALLRAICEHPREDTPRLAFADYLEEHGQPERAAFIRTDVAMALRDEWDAERLKWEAATHPHPPNGKDWTGGPPIRPGPGLSGIDWHESPLFRRGFPWAVRIADTGRFRRSSGELFARHPVEYLAFRDNLPPLPQMVSEPWFSRVTGLEWSAGRYSAEKLHSLLEAPNCNLTDLAVVNLALNIRGMEGLAKSPIFSKLVRLRLSTAFDDLQAALQAFERPPKSCLRLLSIRHPSLNRIALSLPQSFPASLRILELPTSQLTSGGAREFVLRGVTTGLRVLKLTGNPIGNIGGTAVFTSPHFAGLKVLDLSYCMVGDEALRALLENSPLADGLNLLNLTGSPASADMKQAVKERMGDRVRL